MQWSDSANSPREMLLVRNDQLDPTGQYGGYARDIRYVWRGQSRLCSSDNAKYPGFGFTVNHYKTPDNDGGAAVSSRRVAGTRQTLLAGAHHFIHQYRWTLKIDQQEVGVTVHWFVANGRDHPVWSVTYDLHAVPADALRADSRSPYGDIDWTCGADAQVDGVAWGDRYVFRTREPPLSPQSPWSYDESNRVPWVMAWSDAVDAELGLVQTQTRDQQDAGGYWFFNNWTRTSDNRVCEVRDDAGVCNLDADTWLMPQPWNWAYQINNWQLEQNPRSKRLAWGTNFGFVGQRSYLRMSEDEYRTGWPEQSYAVFIVLGPHSTESVRSVVADVESLQEVSVEVSTGALALAGPAGPGSQTTERYEPPGFNPVYAAWEFVANDDGRLEAAFDFVGHSLRNPVLLVNNIQSASLQVAVADSRASVPAPLISLDSASNRAWITLPGTYAERFSVSVLGK